MFFNRFIKSIGQILTLFKGIEKKKLFLLLFGLFLMGIFEVIGVASIAPFIAVVSDPEVIQDNYYLSSIYLYFDFESENSFLSVLGLLSIVLVLFSNCISALINWKIISFSRNQAHLVAYRLLKNYLSQPYVFYLNKNTSNLAKNILSEVDRTINGVVLPGLLALSRLAIAFFIIAFLLYLSPFLALISIVVLGGVYSFIFIVIRKKLNSFGESASQSEADRYKAAGEAMSGIKELKLHNTEEVFLERFETPSKKRAILMSYSQLSSILPRYLLDAIAFGAILSLMTFMVYVGKTSGEIIPIVTVFALAGYRLMPALQQIYASSTQLKFNFPALNILIEDLAVIKNDVAFIKDSNQAFNFSQQININNLSFKYPGEEKTILNNINLTIKLNQTIGLVGSTGSGKTTLIDILLGLLYSTSGEILVDNKKLTSKNIKYWQKNIGYVPQVIYLIDDTIEANIAFGEKIIDFEKVKRASIIAEIDGFIQTLPGHYNTMVGERGVRLSGGQRQRIGIARALYHDPNVLVFDEATSSLDNETESTIMNSITNISHKKTIIMIAHRFTSLIGCDVIYSMNSGSIVNSGTYKQLLKSDEYFKNMENSKNP